MSVTYLEYAEDDLKQRLESLRDKLNRDNYDTLIFEVTKNTFQNILYDFKRYYFEKLFIYEYKAIRYIGNNPITPACDTFIANLINDSINKGLAAADFKEVLDSVNQILGIMTSIFNDRKTVFYSDSFREHIAQEPDYATRKDWVGWLSSVDLIDVVTHITSEKSKTEYRLFDESVPYREYRAEVIDDISIASKDWKIPLSFYGVSTADGLVSEKYKKIIVGKVQETKTSAKSFDIVHSFLPMTAEVSTAFSVNVSGHDNYANIEEILRIRFLSTILKSGGILILHLPVYGLSSDICHEIAKRFTNFSVFRKEKDSYARTVITLVARKRSNNETDGESVKNDYSTLRDIVFKTTYDAEQKELQITLFKQQYVLSANNDKSRNFIFRGDHLSTKELVSFVTKSDLFDQFYDSKETYYDRYEGKHPLLPFTNGQLGLVLVSGFLDGIVEEDEEHCHIVKGRSSKHITSDVDFGEEKVILHRNYSNKIEINMFEPDGTYKNLV